MISDDAQLRQAMEQMERMYRALAAVRREVLPVNPRQFSVMAEGPMDEIRRLQEQIDAYAGTAAVDTDRIPEQWVDWRTRRTR